MVPKNRKVTTCRRLSRTNESSTNTSNRYNCALNTTKMSRGLTAEHLHLSLRWDVVHRTSQVNISRGHTAEHLHLSLRWDFVHATSQVNMSWGLTAEHLHLSLRLHHRWICHEVSQLSTCTCHSDYITGEYVTRSHSRAPAAVTHTTSQVNMSDECNQWLVGIRLTDTMTRWQSGELGI